MIAWRGLAFRASTYDVPLWVWPNRRSGRWNIAGQGCTQYFCLDTEAPYAELLRHEELRTDQEATTLRTILWQADIDEAAVVDYSSFEKAEAAGFPAEALVEDDHERCQAEAARLTSHGATALLTPSAALAGSTNITLFGPRVEVSWTAERLLASQLPVQRLASGGPPAGLAARVQQRGSEYPGLATFVRTRGKRDSEAGWEPPEGTR